MENKKWKEWLGGFRSGEKLPRKNQLLILFLVGLLLLVIVFPVPGRTDNEADLADEGVQSTADLSSTGDYEEYLEEKTAKILSQVEGVGEVTVMITLESGGQKIIEKDQSSSGQTTEETDSEGGTRSVEDRSSDKTSIYVQDSDGSKKRRYRKEKKKVYSQKNADKEETDS